MVAKRLRGRLMAERIQRALRIGALIKANGAQESWQDDAGASKMALSAKRRAQSPYASS
jgi:hypothetical protein